MAQGLALQRLEALEGLAASGVTAATTAASGAEATGLNPAGGGVLAVAGSMKKLQVSFFVRLPANSVYTCVRLVQGVCLLHTFEERYVLAHSYHYSLPCGAVSFIQ